MGTPDPQSDSDCSSLLFAAASMTEGFYLAHSISPDNAHAQQANDNDDHDIPRQLTPQHRQS